LRGAVLEVGLDFQVGVAGARLSNAQRQKLAMARALAKRPSLLIVNEAIQGLDAASQARVLEGVLASAADALLVWVLPPDAERGPFDRLLVFSEGRLARDDSAASPANA
jgi:ABC-type multidrug transport system fused ATPase/permease subunit